MKVCDHKSVYKVYAKGVNFDVEVIKCNECRKELHKRLVKPLFLKEEEYIKLR